MLLLKLSEQNLSHEPKLLECLIKTIQIIYKSTDYFIPLHANVIQLDFIFSQSD